MWLVAQDLGGEASAFGLGDVGKVGQNGLVAVLDPIQQVRVQPPDRQAEAGGVLGGQRERVVAEVAAVDCEVRPLVGSSASATAPQPVPTSSTRQPAGRPSAASTQQLGLGAGDQGARGRRSARASESRAGRGCRRPARARPSAAAPPARSRRARPARAAARVRCAGASAARRGCRRAAARRPDAAPRSRPRPARRSPRASARRRPSHAAVCACRRRRFSSACSASVSSSSSPSRTWSRLWTVSLMRWSVTRRSP